MRLDVDHACGRASFAPWTEADVEQTIWSRFETVLAAHGPCVAVVDGDTRISYDELAARAAAVSDAVRRSGVVAGAPVAVLADQGLSAIAAILGILRAGSPFAPLDVLDPRARAHALLERCGAQAIVASEERRDDAERIAALGGRVVVDADAAASAGMTEVGEATPDAPASVFFTSGSTGTPKAVLDVHRNVLHNTLRYTNLLEVAPSDRLSLIQRPSFSGIASSLFAALLNGAVLCTFPLAPELVTSLATWVRRERISVFHSVPAIFRSLVTDGAAFPDVRVVRLEGDRASWDDVERFRRCFAPSALLANGLGTTETGLACQYRIGGDVEPGMGILPVGLPAPGVEIAILDDGHEPLPPGEVGEIAVRSRFLARGYVGDNSTTSERFRDAGDGSRLYLTGDLGRIGPGGLLEYVGRRDGTLKVGGIRVEPAELEAALLGMERVCDAAVTIDEAPRGGGHLVARVVADRETTGDALRRKLVDVLPAYMIPARIDVVPHLAVDGNWKVRRSDPPLEPSTELERQLRAIWEEVLETPVGGDDMFVELGGDSLAAAEIATAIEQRLGYDVPFALLARAPTVSRLAAALRTTDPGTSVRLVALTNGATGAPLVLIPDHSGEPLMYAALAGSVDRAHPVLGLQLSPRLGDDVSVPATAERIAAVLQDSLPGEPLAIAGYCYGALLALEVTRRLRVDGRDVEPVLLGLEPLDLPGLASEEAGRRWEREVGRKRFGLTRVRFHLRVARERPTREAAGYVAGRVRAALRHAVASRVGPDTPSRLLRDAARGYRPDRLEGSATLILADGAVALYADDAVAAWTGVADRVDVRIVEGPANEHTLLQSPRAARTAVELGDVLASIGARTA